MARAVSQQKSAFRSHPDDHRDRRRGGYGGGGSQVSSSSDAKSSSAVKCREKGPVRSGSAGSVKRGTVGRDAVGHQSAAKPSLLRSISAFIQGGDHGVDLAEPAVAAVAVDGRLLGRGEGTVDVVGDTWSLLQQIAASRRSCVREHTSPTVRSPSRVTIVYQAAHPSIRNPLSLMRFLFWSWTSASAPTSSLR